MRSRGPAALVPARHFRDRSVLVGSHTYLPVRETPPGFPQGALRLAPACPARTPDSLGLAASWLYLLHSVFSARTLSSVRSGAVPLPIHRVALQPSQDRVVQTL